MMNRLLKIHLFEIAVFLFAGILLFFSMYQTIYPYFLMPEGRTFTFLEGFSEDFIQYVSFVKEGMYGRNHMVIRSVPYKNQTPTVIHMEYILIGKIGRLLKVSAPVAYHLARAVIGLLFVYVVYVFFLNLLVQSKAKAFFATVLAFLSGSFSWYVWQNGMWDFKTLPYYVFISSNLSMRVASRPHYELGASLFIGVVMLLLFFKTNKIFRKYTIVFILSLLLSIVHSPFGIVLCITELVVGGIGILLRILKKEEIGVYLVSVAGLFFGLFLSYIGTKQPYIQEVYFDRGVMPFTIDALIYFGPSLWLGFPGLILGIFLSRHRFISLFLFVWILVQFSFLFYFSPFIHSDPYRFIQSLYFVALAFGVVNLLTLIEKFIKKTIFYIGIIVLILFSIPQYIHDYQQSFTYKKENKSGYSAFTFPSHNLRNAYAYLDKNTPVESTVLASYEASRNILIFSHNFVIGNEQNWSRDEGLKMKEERNYFLQGYLNEQQMKAYLKKYDIRYIYGGYQEKMSTVLDVYNNLFEPVYTNPEVTIYRVK